MVELWALVSCSFVSNEDARPSSVSIDSLSVIRHAGRGSISLSGESVSVTIAVSGMKSDSFFLVMICSEPASLLRILSKPNTPMEFKVNDLKGFRIMVLLSPSRLAPTIESAIPPMRLYQSLGLP